MRARKWLASLCALIVIVGAAGVVSAVMERRGEPQHPHEWAAEVIPFVEFVEAERGLEFEHPVRVDLLSDSAYRAELADDSAELTTQRRGQIDVSARLLGAVGLVERPLDLVDATSALLVEGTGGSYAIEGQRIRLRGETLTPSVAVTLVHELTHALQDQHFDLGSRYDELEDDSEATAAFGTLQEGDAFRVQSAYERSMSDEDRADLVEQQSRIRTDFEQASADVPPILETLFFAPYVFGDAMLDLAVAVNGPRAVDALFSDPPTTEEHLMDPWTLIEDDDQAVPVSDPPIHTGEREVGRDGFGMLSWYLMLGARLDHVTALDAADGWGGSSFVVFERDGVDCVRLRYRGDEREDLEEMRVALTEWIDAVPGSPASVESVGSELEFESCEPRAHATGGSGSPDEAVSLALARTNQAILHYRAYGDGAAARCVGNALVHRYTPEQLSDPTLRDDPSVATSIRQLTNDCR